MQQFTYTKLKPSPHSSKRKPDQSPHRKLTTLSQPLVCLSPPARQALSFFLSINRCLGEHLHIVGFSYFSLPSDGMVRWKLYIFADESGVWIWI